MIIGDVAAGRVVLAPLSGIADSPFRRIAKEFGAGLVYSEMVSAEGLIRESRKTSFLLKFTPQERPIGIQLFGSSPEAMARAAQMVAEQRPDFIDVNLGCPARRVIRAGSGAALLRELHLIERIFRAMVEAVDVPVTAKLRIGWDKNSIVAVAVATMAQECGIKALAIHGRTYRQGFKGSVDWEEVARAKEAVSIPVMGNGELWTPQHVERMLNETGCDAAMIGRGALGNPWIFRHTEQYIETGDLPPFPGLRERIQVCQGHCRMMVEEKGERTGVMEMRKHIRWYTRGMPNSASLRARIFRMTDSREILALLDRYLIQHQQEQYRDGAVKQTEHAVTAGIYH